MGRTSRARKKKTKWGVTNLFEKTATDTPRRTKQTTLKRTRRRRRRRRP